MKVCPHCKSHKSESEFGRCASRKDGLAAYCRECTSEMGRDYYLRNKDKVLQRTNARGTRWYWQNKEAARTINKAYRESHQRELADKKKRRRNRELDRLWDQRNRARKSEYWRAYDARKNSACPAWASREKMRVFYEEARRRTQETGVQYEVDHIVPLKGETVCGLHCEFNLRVITKSQNASKCNRWAA